MTAIELGKITKPHGLRGEVKLRLHWDQSDSLGSLRSIHVVDGSGRRTTYAVDAARRVGKGYLLKLRGVDDCDAAEGLRDCRVEASRDELPALEPGEYYLCDLVGLRVQIEGGRNG